jgi:AbrB family looped-hinge helix DNA binding protein
MKAASDLQFYGTVTVGERGQIAIPQEAREKYGIQPGDKLLVVSSVFGGVALVPQQVLQDLLRSTYLSALAELQGQAEAPKLAEASGEQKPAEQK